MPGLCDPVPVNLAQAMKQIVPGVQDLKRRSLRQAGGEATMSPTLIALREDRVLAVITAPRLEVVLSCASTLAIGLAPQMLAVAAQVTLPERAGSEDLPPQEAGEGIAYTTFTRDREASLAVQRYQVQDGEVVFTAPERGRPDDRRLMDELAKAMGHAPLDPAKVARKDPAGQTAGDQAGQAPQAPVSPDFIPAAEGRMAIDAGTIKTTYERVKGIGGTALFVAADGTQATRMLAAGLPQECLLTR